MSTPRLGAASRQISAAVVWLALAGCAVLRQAPVSETAPAPPPAAAPVAAPEVRVPPETAAPPAPPPETRPVPPSPPPPRDVVVLFAPGTRGYADVAARITAELPSARYRVALTDIAAAGTAEALAALGARADLLVIAVGREAAELARAKLAGRPIIFCQVFNDEDLLAAGGPIWGVRSVPPLALQLRSWKAIDTSLARIALIVSEGHEDLVAEAKAAAQRFSVALTVEVSASDRETLYLSKRLASEVDGLWLLPDNRILSPAVLEELLGYALAHRVGVLVFNEALLPWGALMSASSTAGDVARTVESVLDRLAAGRADALPAMTPLSEVELQFNADAASQLGLGDVPHESSVLREPD
jgi:ABC-type uncharacterized transport system substrate-binding protein